MDYNSHAAGFITEKLPGPDISMELLCFLTLEADMPRNCVHNADNFCYICGEVTFALQKQTLTAMVRKAYHFYFGCKIGDQDKSWAPHYCCNTCASNLRQWLNKKRKSMPFAVPMI